MAGAEPDDAVLLTPLTEETLVKHLHTRFSLDLIYTWVGNTLLSLNPGRALPLYSAELARTYLKTPPHHLPPHIYAVTAEAYKWVRDRGENQFIVITGESGAGKTEAARVCIQCAVLASEAAAAGVRGGAGSAGGAGALLAAAGTVLEAFGNAATARNHNASRFGKLTDIEVDFRGIIVSGHITHFLLEKGRVASVPPDERNFHAFYQLLAGADSQLLKRLKLQRSCQSYRILRGGCAGGAGGAGGSPRREPAAPLAHAAAADTEQFAFTKSGLERLGVCYVSVARVLAFLLKLGNVRFSPELRVDGALKHRAHHQHELYEACELVGLDPDSLLLALTDANESESEGESDTGEGEDAGGEGTAGAARDALLTAVYGRLFAWLVARVNDALGGAPTSGATLGILDASGFERVNCTNLERLLSNYCCERVQACVDAVLRRELAEWAREGVVAAAGGDMLAVSAAEDAADTLDAGPESVLSIIRAAGANRDDGEIMARLRRARHARVTLQTPQHFRVCHFAGAVSYGPVRGWWRAESEWLPRAAARALHHAQLALLHALFPLAPRTGSPRRAASLSLVQRAVVGGVCRRLGEHGEHAARLVRCLRAPPTHHQLRAQGIVELALVRRAGWSAGLPAPALLSRYGCLAPAGALTATSHSSINSASLRHSSGKFGTARGSHTSLNVSGDSLRASSGKFGTPRGSHTSLNVSDDEMRRCKVLLYSLPLPRREFAFGETKVFVKSPRTLWELERLRSARVLYLVRVVQRYYRARLARRRHAAATIARHWRRRRRRRRTKLQRNYNSAALTICSWWVSTLAGRYLRWAAAATPPAPPAAPLRAPWPPLPDQHAKFARAHQVLGELHYRWRCYRYRLQFDQTARNRMREKVTASLLFAGRKAGYSRTVPRAFAGDYVRLRASPAWRRMASQLPHDRYVVFADLVHKVSLRRGRAARAVCVVSTAALLVLEPRSLRVRRRLPAAAVAGLALSPHRDPLLAVHAATHAHCCETAASCSSDDAWASQHGCLSAGRWREGSSDGGGDDLLLQCTHAIELATKLFLVVQNARRAPRLLIHHTFDLMCGEESVTVSFHVDEEGGVSAGCAGGVSAELGGGARIVRRPGQLLVLL